MDALYCQNAACYLTFQCCIKNRAENCSIHRRFLKGESVIQYTEEELEIMTRQENFPVDSTVYKYYQ